jgi:FkbM family methyltransferase
MLKKIIQDWLNRAGYRLVPHALDAKSFRRALQAKGFGTIIDVGAASGSTVLQWLEEFPNAHVHAVEPLPDSFEAVKRIAARYPGRVTPWNFAASDVDATTTMYSHPDHTTSSSLLARTEYCANILPSTNVEKAIAIDTRRLDTALPGDLAGDILLKMDVQGTEDKVIRGATNLLKKTSCVLTEISIAGVYHDQCTFSVLNRLMEDNGFQLSGFLEQFHLTDGTPVYADVVYSRSDV